MSRDFVQVIPLANLAIFLALGVLLAGLVAWGGERGRWLGPRLLATLTLIPPVWAVSPRVYGPAGALLALGLAVRLVPVLERSGDGFRRLVRLSFPLAASFVPVAAVVLWSGERVGAGREPGGPVPPPGSANVLLVVLDTVAAEHLSLYGYERPTSLTLDALAGRGIRFDRAQATSSWTLPSHASLFTGRSPHELSAGWITPLDGEVPTLAEYLGSHGYATAGFVANRWYCAYDSGLGRGFLVYRDYGFPGLDDFGSAGLIDRPVDGLKEVGRFLDERCYFDLLRGPAESLARLFEADRKEAVEVNREFLEWLSRRGRAARPFFAFLNYYDAHFPYALPEGHIHRFGIEPVGGRERELFEPEATVDRRPTALQVAQHHDAYDNCVADLDEQLGRLIDELGRRGVLERTWVIVTSDHGESFGEHADVFRHGTSLYQTEVHIPLVILPPAGVARPARAVVAETVSLRELPATVVDLLGIEAGSPFPGESLARLWEGAGSSAANAGATSRRALMEVVPLDGLDPDPSQLLVRRWPWAALSEGEWTYIRHEGRVREELYHLRDDAGQSHDLAAEPALRPRFERMRHALNRLTGGPLTPRRFSR